MKIKKLSTMCISLLFYFKDYYAAGPTRRHHEFFCSPRSDLLGMIFETPYPFSPFAIHDFLVQPFSELLAPPLVCSRVSDLAKV